MNQRIKVLHIHVLPVISGSGINTFISMDGMDRDRYQVEFACAPGGPLIDKTLDAGLAFHPIRHFVQPIRPYHDLRALFQLIKLIRREKYHIVHTHNSKGGILGRFAARFAGSPIVIHTIHGFAFHDAETPLRRKLFIFLERWTAKYAHQLISISQPLIDWGLRLNIGKPEQYVKIYSGIEIEKFRIAVDVPAKRQEFGLRPDDLVFGLVAKLWDGKGHKLAIDALKIILPTVPNAKLVFVGEGYLQPQLEKWAEESGVRKSVIFTGFRTDIAELNAMLDVAVLASDFEGMGRVLLEAMVMGKPVIATNVGGIPDVVDDGVTGMLIPRGDVTAFADAILKMLQDPQLRMTMGQAGYRKITEQFSAQTMVHKIALVYDQLIEKHLPELRRDP